MPLTPGALSARIQERLAEACAAGAVTPIETVQTEIEDSGIRFAVRQASSLAYKPSRRSARAVADPFCPYEQALHVADVSDTHVALLNKYPVLEGHLLLVTRRFAHQDSLLDAADLGALAACMAEMAALGFYNGGEAAGASQAHKHLQLVPLPLSGAGQPTPIDAALRTPERIGGISRSAALPFAHGYLALPPGLISGADSGIALCEHYRRLGQELGICTASSTDTARALQPYNLLLTARWMLLVPRSKGRFGRVSVNALGFAGSLFVQRAEDVETIRRTGPLNVLRAVARPG
jgi:ATP adenylyltransferase